MQATYSEITTIEIESATSKFSNQQSPGLDKLHNFWWNKLTTLHPKIAIAFNKLIVQPENCPDWLTIMKPPTKEDVEKFWKPLYENKKEYIKERHGCRNTNFPLITSCKRHIVR